jgi:hypothetical protein
VGQEVILELVDPSFSGEYRLAIDPSEKDALLCAPGAGLGFLGKMGLADEASRFDRTDDTRPDPGGKPAFLLYCPLFVTFRLRIPSWHSAARSVANARRRETGSPTPTT